MFARRQVRFVLASLMAAAVLPACAKPLAPSVAAAPQSAKPAMIGRDLLFGNPEKTAVKISRDGKYLSYLAPVQGVLNVWVGTVSDPASARPVTQDIKRGIRSYWWPHDSRYLVYVQDRDGDENWHVYRVDLESQRTKDLTPYENVHARFMHHSPHRPGEALIAINKRDPKVHDVYRVDLASGECEEIERNEAGYVDYLADDDNALRVALKVTADGGTEVFRRGKEGWQSAFKVAAEDSAQTWPIVVAADGKAIYMTDSRGRDAAALVRWDLRSDTFDVLAENPRADAFEPLFHPATRAPQAVAFEYTRRDWTFLDDAVKTDFEVLGTVTRGEIHIGSRTLDDRLWIVSFSPDDGPVRYYQYDRDTQKATFLFTDRPLLESKKLARMYPVVIKARDGLPLVSYYTLPRAFDDGEGKAKTPLPMVLNVHGGPWSRDRWGFEPEHQWLADRGYAVLSVNFRGSAGFGKSFLNAGNMQWGAKMHDDLMDAVAWAVANGIAQADRVAIYGQSYGGYATLVGLTFTPERFACGVDVVGPSNLVTLLTTIPPYWAPMAGLLTRRVGDHRTEQGRTFLDGRSPLGRADQIKRPLLIAQGANDPRVKQSESDQIVKAMRRHKIPVTYVLYGDEGHGFRRPENRTSFYAISESFLAECLGGRAEAYGSDLAGADFTVPEGAEHVPGLSAELQAPEQPQPSAKQSS